MEVVALLKQENRKLGKQISLGSLGGVDERSNSIATTATKNSSPVKGASKISAKEIAALNVEHQMLTQQVEEMKKFIEENQDKMN